MSLVEPRPRALTYGRYYSALRQKVNPGRGPIRQVGGRFVLSLPVSGRNVP